MNLLEELACAQIVRVCALRQREPHKEASVHVEFLLFCFSSEDLALTAVKFDAI